MCGIVAMYSAREPVSAAALDQATRRLTHRGPDAQRTWVSADRRVGLAEAEGDILIAR
jgi:asparagine synthase (glutamine-hydrolysing)